MNINKINKLLGITRRSFCALDNTSYTLLNKTMVRHHHEYDATICHSYKKVTKRHGKSTIQGYQVQIQHFTFKLCRLPSCSIFSYIGIPSHEADERFMTQNNIFDSRVTNLQ